MSPEIACTTAIGFDVQFVKNGEPIARGQGSKILQIRWGRALDVVSQGAVTFTTPGLNCCGSTRLIDHWNTIMSITYLGDEIWTGPVTKVAYRKGFVEVEGLDLLAFANRRRIRADYDQTLDSAVIATQLWNLWCSDVDAEVLTYPTGIVENRKVAESDTRMLWSFYGEMLPTSLDVTTFGSRILFGLPEFNPINLDDTQVQGDVAVIKDGSQMGTSFLANASKDVTGLYPPGPPTGETGYPLLETVINDGTIQDSATALNTAHAAYDFAENGIRRVEASGGLILLPESNVDPHKLVAGQLINFSATQTCYPAIETLRLGSVEGVVEKGREVVTINLQPAGAIQGLDVI